MNNIRKININTTRPELSGINIETGNLNSEIKSSLPCLGKLLPQAIINNTSKVQHQSNKNLGSEIKSCLLRLGKLLPKPLVLITKVGHQETSLLQIGIGIRGFFDHISQ